MTVQDHNVLEIMRHKRAAKWNREDYPFRNALMRGKYPLHGLMLADPKNMSLWLAASKTSGPTLWQMMKEVVESETAENEVLGVLRFRVANWLGWDLTTEHEEKSA